MPRYMVTGRMKVRDVVDADDREQALKRFRALYPAFQDKGSKITEIQEIKKGGSNAKKKS